MPAQPRLAKLALMLLICPPLAATAADRYWDFSYLGTEVLSSRSAQDAIDTARNLNRLDLAIRQFLNIRANIERAPTSVYALTRPVYQQVRGNKDSTTTEYRSNPFSNTIVIDTSNTSDNRMLSAYFGYTGSILLSAYSFRYPDWFLTGLSQLFAASEIRGHEVTIGTPDPNRSSQLYAGTRF